MGLSLKEKIEYSFTPGSYSHLVCQILPVLSETKDDNEMIHVSLYLFVL